MAPVHSLDQLLARFPLVRSSDAGYASAAAVAGLAREVEALRRAIEPLRELPGHVDELADLVARLAETTAANVARPAPAIAPSWLTLPADVRTAVLRKLTGWIGAVYLRYPDAAAALPDCWLWHPDVVEELLWLRHAWLAAYRDETATVQLAGDWHDRYRPGAVRRIKTAAGTCSLDNHPPRDGNPSGAPVPLGEAAAELIATWWATRRDQPAPKPTDEHLAAALTRRGPGARR